MAEGATVGSLPADSEQFMLIEHMAGQIEKHTQQLEGGMHNKVNIEFLSKQVEKLQKAQEAGMHNKVNIEFLQKQVEKLVEDVEELKDSNREIHYKNGGQL